MVNEEAVELLEQILSTLHKINAAAVITMCVTILTATFCFLIMVDRK